jgi:hypothetical protein
MSGLHGLHSLPHRFTSKLAQAFAYRIRELLPNLLFASRDSDRQCVTR